VARADEVAHGFVAHLRAALGEPRLELAGTPEVLTGGFDTEIFAVRLRSAPPRWMRPLVLRVLRAHHAPGMVLREQAVHNALADAGYPAPRVLLATTDPAALGAAFLVMERVAGVPLIEANPLGMHRVLLDAQLGLHDVDPAPVVRALGPAIAFDGYLATLEERTLRAMLTGLAPAVRWLRARRPPADVAPVVCHGDLHPRNVLVEGGRLTGVLDWPNAVVAEPAFDVASSRNILRFVPPGVASVPRPLRGLARLGQPILAWRYLAGYRRRRAMPAERLAYYEVAAAMRALVRVGESRRRTPGAPPPGPLDRSTYTTRLLAHVVRVTGLDVTLPPLLDGP
jgi:aminoglycoside phosphotransferase (APT) family kinase protein